MYVLVNSNHMLLYTYILSQMHMINEILYNSTTTIFLQSILKIKLTGYIYIEKNYLESLLL